MNFKKSLSLMLLAIIFLSSCKNEPCDDIICQNNGICIDGLCDCPDGFEGELCEEFSRQKILGNFDVSSDCVGDSSETNVWSIAASASTANEVLISSIHKPTLNVSATITDANAIEIEEQFVSDGIFNYNVYGSGTIESEGQFSMEYTVINIGLSDTTTCSVNAIRK